jgi:hypothetical protein
MKTFTAYFHTDADYAARDFAADTPERALKKARRFLAERLDDLVFERYDDGFPVNEIAIHDGGYNNLAVWRDDDKRLHLAASDLLEAAEKVVARWRRGDLAAAVRDLAAAIAKAKEGAG